MSGNFPEWHEHDRSGWHGNVHMYAPACIKTPPWASHERLSGLEPAETVIADCCLCKMRADETVCQIVTGLPLPLGLPEDEQMDWLWGSFFEGYVKIECGPGFGCNVKPRRRSSRHLREHWYEYD